jgi:hypothetical protein
LHPTPPIFSPVLDRVNINEHNHWTEKSKTMRWFRRLVPHLSPGRSGFSPRTVQVGFVVYKEPIKQFFFPRTSASSVSVIPPILHSFIHSFIHSLISESI